MADRASEADGIAMRGGYSLATVGAKHVIDGALPLVLDALERIAPERGAGIFTMADFGCADGGTSLDMVTTVLREVRRRAPERPIAMVYTDQPRNDFNALFAIVQAPGRLDGITGLDVLASATSFYRRILPPGSLSLGFSATAMHWLSAKPCNVSDHVQAVGATGPSLPPSPARAVPTGRPSCFIAPPSCCAGGRLVLVNFCRDEAGRYLGHTAGVDMFDTFARLWRELVADGTIAEAEYREMTLPQYYKSVAEFAAPLTDPGDPVAPCRAAARSSWRPASSPAPSPPTSPGTATPPPSPGPMCRPCAPGPRAPSTPRSPPRVRRPSAAPSSTPTMTATRRWCASGRGATAWTTSMPT